jgi:hypothetical protein
MARTPPAGGWTFAVCELGNVPLSAPVSMTVTATPTAAGTVSAFVELINRETLATVASASETTTITVLNSAPVAADDAYVHYGSDTALNVTGAAGVLANDSDGDPGPAHCSIGERSCPRQRHAASRRRL